ncbi:MAG TPA: hypothetical protein VIH03_02470 [Nitrososphaerales archaeon]
MDVAGYYNFLTGLVTVLFVATLVIIFAYEYESLRRASKEQPK